MFHHDGKYLLSLASISAALTFLVFLLFTACVSDSRHDGSRTPTAAEWYVIQGTVDRYEEMIEPLPDSAKARIDRALVYIADREDMLRYCWKDEPGHCPRDKSQWTSKSEWGCAAGCYNPRSYCDGIPFDWDCTPYPVFVAWYGLTDEAHLNLLKQETVHAINHAVDRDAYSHLPEYTAVWSW